MAAAIRAEAVIERPVEDVFAYVLDLETNGPEWASDLESVTKTTGGPVGAGTTFEQKQTSVMVLTHQSGAFCDASPARTAGECGFTRFRSVMF